MVQYKIRPATDRDLKYLKNILSGNKQKNNIIINDASLYFIAVTTKSKIIGLIGAEICNENALLRSASIAGTYKNKGIGKKLVQTLLEALKKRNIRTVYLFSLTSGEYWQKFGFKQCKIQEMIDKFSGSPQVSANVVDHSIWNDISWRLLLEYT